MHENIKKPVNEKPEELQVELDEWDGELRRLQDLMLLDKTRQKLVDSELPELKKQIEEQEANLPDITSKAEEVWFLRHIHLLRLTIFIGAV